MQWLFAASLGGAFLLAFPIPCTSQTTDIRGAAIALLPKTVDIERVTIANLRNSPLVLWQIRLPSNTGESVQTSDFSWQPIKAEPGAGPIQPNERRAIDSFPLKSPGTDPVTLQLGVWADGYVEGSPKAVEHWRRERRELRDEAMYWVRVFAEMPRDSEARAKTFLAARLSERAAQAPRDRSGIRADLGRVWRRPWNSPGKWLSIVNAVRQTAEEQLETSTRVLSSMPSEPTPAVAVASERATATDYAASITNLRNAGIEAFGFEVFDPGVDTPRAGQSADYCLAAAAEFGVRHGRIAPGDSHESPLGWKIDPLNPPTLRLTFVIYDDLSFEGSTKAVEDLFKVREELADEMAYANAVRYELAKLPADQVHAFVVTKRAERMKELMLNGRTPRLHELDELIEQARRSPEQLRKGISAMIDLAEQHRARLLRHRSAG